ncbi:DNA repair helicase component of transcription factor b (nucleomorph) [Guillardia theta]|uniref:DNA repair helicase component of transcription factor b n=1 Tax=Guillardia theta TaxID=55529 RepID=Q98S94_GUITH|nr:DNA repair helicase component of transcription factor b [Guillardia theta]AAK39689.1 DNA repair helicase component of transcription factor b [Guillardia theta]
MIILIDNLKIFLPFKKIYPEQIQLLHLIKKLWDMNDNIYFKIPKGVGLSIILFLLFYYYFTLISNEYKFIFVVENSIEKENISTQILYLRTKGINLNNRILNFPDRNDLCINSKVNSNYINKEIDNLCTNLIKSSLDVIRSSLNSKFDFVNKFKLKPNCNFYINFLLKKRKIYKNYIDTRKILKFSRNNKVCPYFFILNNVEDYNFLILKFDQIIHSSKNYNLTKNKKKIFLLFSNFESFSALLKSKSIISLSLKTIIDSYRSLIIVERDIIKKKIFQINVLKTFNNFHLKKNFFYIKKNKKILNNYLVTKLNFQNKFLHELYYLNSYRFFLETLLKLISKKEEKYISSINIYKDIFLDENEIEIAPVYFQNFNDNISHYCKTYSFFDNKSLNGIKKISNFLILTKFFLNYQNNFINIKSELDKNNSEKFKLTLEIDFNFGIFEFFFELFRSIFITINNDFEISKANNFFNCKNMFLGSIKNYQKNKNCNYILTKYVNQNNKASKKDLYEDYDFIGSILKLQILVVLFIFDSNNIIDDFTKKFLKPNMEDILNFRNIIIYENSNIQNSKFFDLFVLNFELGLKCLIITDEKSYTDFNSYFLKHANIIVKFSCERKKNCSRIGIFGKNFNFLPKNHKFLTISCTINDINCYSFKKKYIPIVIIDYFKENFFSSQFFFSFSEEKLCTKKKKQNIVNEIKNFLIKWLSI